MENHSSFGVLMRKERTRTPTNTFIDEDLPTPHLAAAKGEVVLLTKTIKKDRRRLEERSRDGLTPLAQAVQNQQLRSVKQLIEMGADIDAQDNIGRTCLSVAAYQGWHEGVVCLLHHGAKRNICDKSGRSPLHAATYHSDTNTLSILLNSLSIEEINHSDNEMMTAVHWAAFHDRPDHLMQLIQKKADVFARDIDGKLPLHWAAQNGSFQCVHRLTSLPEGLSTINDVDSSGKAPVHYAAAAGSANILTILSHCDNIDFELEDPDERTPLHWATAMGHARAVETLLKLGANPCVHDVDGCTPLDYARQAENPDCLKIMESCLGKRGSRQSLSGVHAHGKSARMRGDERYRYRKGETPPDNIHILPDIKVMAPTATQTQTKTTTNKTIPHAMSEREHPRMYSASTDTDALEFSGPPFPHRQQNQQHQSNLPSEQKIFSVNNHSNIFTKLIGSSFLAGAQAAILNSEEMEDNIDTSNHRRDMAPENVNSWANQTGNTRPRITTKKDKGTLEMKMMTSQNTPDLNRVSVKSFRSIPPTLNQDNDSPDSLSKQSPRDTTCHIESETLARNCELPPVHLENNALTLTSSRVDDTTWKGMTKPYAPSKTKQITTTQPPPHDFMTTNNAETRILTRMLRSNMSTTLHQQPSHINTPHGGVDKDGIKRSFGVPSTLATVLQQQRRNKEDRPSVHKHSRIPSTRIVINSQTHKNTGTQNNDTGDASLMKSARSPSGIVLTGREKYLESEDVSKPIDPKPLLSIHLTGPNKGKTEKHSELPNLQNKSKSKRKNKDATKSRHALEKLSSRFGGVGVSGGVVGEVPVPVSVRNETNHGGESILKMPPIHKEGVEKNLRRVRHDRKIQQLAFS